jgi:chemotaxis protein methyltransferase CheR
LIYFDPDSRDRAVRRLTSFLSPDGYFFVGHAESLHCMNGSFRTVIPTVYAWKPAQEKNAKS